MSILSTRTPGSKCKTGMIAASRLQALIDSRAGQPDIAKIMLQVNQIIEAVRSTVPEDMWPEIVAKLDGGEQHPEALDVGMDSFDDAETPCDRTRVHRRRRRVLTSAARRHRGQWGPLPVWTGRSRSPGCWLLHLVEHGREGCLKP